MVVAKRLCLLPASIPLRKATAATPKATLVMVMPMQMTSAPRSERATIEFSRQNKTIRATAGQGTIPVMAATPMISRQLAVAGMLSVCSDSLFLRFKRSRMASATSKRPVIIIKM